MTDIRNYSASDVSPHRRWVLGLILTGGVDLAKHAESLPRWRRGGLSLCLNSLVRLGWIDAEHELTDLGKRVVYQYEIRSVELEDT